MMVQQSITFSGLEHQMVMLLQMVQIMQKMQVGLHHKRQSREVQNLLRMDILVLDKIRQKLICGMIDAVKQSLSFYESN